MNSPEASTSRQGHDSARKRPRARAVSSLPSRKHGGNSGTSSGSIGGRGDGTSSLHTSSSPITTTAHRFNPPISSDPSSVANVSKPKKLIKRNEANFTSTRSSSSSSSSATRRKSHVITLPFSPPSSDTDEEEIDQLQASNEAGSSTDTLKGGSNDDSSSSSELDEKEKKRRAMNRLRKARKAKEEKLPFVSPLTSLRIKSRAKGKAREKERDDYDESYGYGGYGSQFDELSSNPNHRRNSVSPQRQQTMIPPMPWELDEDAEDDGRVAQMLLQTQPIAMVNGEEVYRQRKTIPVLPVDPNAEDYIPPPLEPRWDRNRKQRPESSRNLFEATQQPLELPSARSFSPLLRSPQFDEDRQRGEESLALPSRRFRSPSICAKPTSQGPGTPSSKSPPVKLEYNVMSPSPIRERSPSIPPPLRSSNQCQNETLSPSDPLQAVSSEHVLEAAPRAGLYDENQVAGSPSWLVDDDPYDHFNDQHDGFDELHSNPFFSQPPQPATALAPAEPPDVQVLPATTHEEMELEQMELDELESVAEASSDSNHHGKFDDDSIPVQTTASPPKNASTIECPKNDHSIPLVGEADAPRSSRSIDASEAQSTDHEFANVAVNDGPDPSASNLRSPAPSTTLPSSDKGRTTLYEADISAEADYIDLYEPASVDPTIRPGTKRSTPSAPAQSARSNGGNQHQVNPSPPLLSGASVPAPPVQINAPVVPDSSAPKAAALSAPVNEAASNSSSMPTSEDESQQCPFCSHVYPICVLPEHVETCEREQITVASSPERPSAVKQMFSRNNDTRRSNTGGSHLTSIRNVKQIVHDSGEPSNNAIDNPLEKFLFPPPLPKARQSFDPVQSDKGKGKARTVEDDDSDLTSPDVPLRSVHISPSRARKQPAFTRPAADDIIDLHEEDYEQYEDDDIEPVIGPSKPNPWFIRKTTTVNKPLRAPEKSSAASTPRHKQVVETHTDDDAPPRGSIYVSKLPKQIREGYYRLVGLDSNGSIPFVQLENLAPKPTAASASQGFRRFPQPYYRRGQSQQKKGRIAPVKRKPTVKKATQRKRK